MKKDVIIGIILLVVLNFITSGCGAIATTATCAVGYGIDRLATPGPTTNPADKALKNAKESIIKTKGKPDNIVKIDDAGSEVWEYYNVPEKGKVKLYAFLNGALKMTGGRNIDEYGANSNNMAFLKKRYIDTVPCYANLRASLSYTPRPGDTAETVLAQLGKPDDSIPLYYENDKVVSEMLIYYESPKKFLAVNIIKGEVKGSQEFELQDEQSVKDVLISNGYNISK
ncbi:MAG: hypothetical protein ACOYU4_04975 [Thermodesulfobacteriota bacterium]